MTRALAALALLGVAVAACGRGEPPASPVRVSDAGLQHIHGLGVNPADGALIVATHSGLFRSAANERTARRIGDRHQDTMGFTVVGPDRFLGSGHPDVREDLPPLLGLIRSDDGGRTWEPVSLLGKADFHVLRVAGSAIYGFDATRGRLLKSSDEGRTWERLGVPGAVIDLAVDPADDRRVALSTDAGLHLSADGGRSWRPVSRSLAGLMAWTDALVLVDGAGVVRRSRDGGRSFEAAGRLGGRPAALTSDGGDLYVALHDNSVRRSTDGGRTWTLRLDAGQP